MTWSERPTALRSVIRGVQNEPLDLRIGDIIFGDVITASGIVPISEVDAIRKISRRADIRRYRPRPYTGRALASP
jgi:hypothetical protein